MFASFLFEREFGVVDVERGVIKALGGWENRVTVTSPEDIGKMTAEVMFHQPRFRNQTVYVAGDTVNYKDVANTLDRISGKEITRHVSACLDNCRVGRRITCGPD